MKTKLQLLVWPRPLRSPLFFCRARLTCQRRRSRLQWSSRIPAWLSPSWTWNWNCYPAKVEVPKTKKPLPLQVDEKEEEPTSNLNFLLKKSTCLPTSTKKCTQKPPLEQKENQPGSHQDEDCTWRCYPAFEWGSKNRDSHRLRNSPSACWR